MKALILATALILSACQTTESALTDAQAGYDQAAYDACVDSDEFSPACAELVND